MSKSKVSIIIPTYRRSDRIQRAVQSALNQDYKNFEVIVVDDNEPISEERIKTKEVIAPYLNYPNFLYVEHPKNMNGAAARNTGIRNSTGKYITFLDDDDEYYPNKIRIQVECLSNLNEEWGLCYTGYDKIDQYGNKQVSSERSEGDVIIQALTKNLFLGSGSNFMIRRSVVEEINGFDESFERNQDLEFLVRALINYKIKHIDHKTFLIHNEIREVTYSYEELLKINEKYKKKFEPYITRLNTIEQREVYNTLDLWDIRSAVTNLKLVEAFKLFSVSNLSFLDVIEYFFYLFNRYLSKKSYGFKFK